jgi:tRNA A-37 threonylcarbamoyl transferase component Bud32
VSGGSPVPEDFDPLPIIKYEPIFSRPDTVVKLKKSQSVIKLKMEGEGSYAVVFSFKDPDYGLRVAVKRAKRHISESDLERFKREFDILKGLSFPYVVEVYEYDRERNEYKMEYCNETLRKYIARRNSNLGFASRKRIALQFLYGINYIHRQDLLHRDISLQNVLLKVYDSGAVLVKLSDFGLVKNRGSDLTRTGTDMRGTIRDPVLTSFKEYAVVNEIYSLGWVLSYIFYGREALQHKEDDVSEIIGRCTASDTSRRYQQVVDLIADVERLDAPPSDAPA